MSWSSTSLRAEKLTDWVEEQFYLLIDVRYRQRLPVLASLNCRKEALGQQKQFIGVLFLSILPLIPFLYRKQA